MEINEKQLNRLRDEASALKKKLPPDAPFFIEFAGTPKSGKSTCIDIVNHFFRRLDFKVLAPTEGASKRTPYYLKDHLVAFNAWSATYALTHILEGKYGSDKYNLVIMDRGLFDALAWFELLKSEGDINENECQTIQDFLLLGEWRNLVGIVFLFETDPATSLQRENDHKLIDQPGRAMNPEFLQKLNDAYTATKERYSSEFPLFHVVNTSESEGSTAESTAFEVANKIVEQLRERIM